MNAAAPTVASTRSAVPGIDNRRPTSRAISPPFFPGISTSSSITAGRNCNAAGSARADSFTIITSYWPEFSRIMPESRERFTSSSTINTRSLLMLISEQGVCRSGLRKLPIGQAARALLLLKPGNGATYFPLAIRVLVPPWAKGLGSSHGDASEATYGRFSSPRHR